MNMRGKGYTKFTLGFGFVSVRMFWMTTFQSSPRRSYRSEYAMKYVSRSTKIRRFEKAYCGALGVPSMISIVGRISHCSEKVMPPSPLEGTGGNVLPWNEAS